MLSNNEVRALFSYDFSIYIYFLFIFFYFNKSSAEISKISASVFNSISVTGRVCPSSFESEEGLISIPLV